MIFLSVTYEEPEVVDRFRENKPMQAWIGHDTDRSMLGPFGIRTWPTVLVVKNGILVGRPTNPTSLTAADIRAYEKGRIDKREEAEPSTADESVGPDGRPLFRGSRAGFDPFSRLTERPTYQLIVRQAGAVSESSLSGADKTLLGATVPEIVAAFWGVDRFLVMHDVADTREFDVVFCAPPELVEPVAQHTRALVAASLDVAVRVEARDVDGYVLVSGKAGPKLKPGQAREVGWGTNSRGGVTQFTSASVSLATFAKFVGRTLGAPVDDRTKLEGYYFIEVALPSDPNEVRQSLLETCGLELQRAKVRREVAVVERSGE